MQNITFISTIHEELGKCNPIRLCKIIKNINPEVIFLEALNETYSEYQKHLFSTFGVFHKKLEVSAIQNYSLDYSFEYVPVLDKEMDESFEKKYEIVCKNRDWQKLMDNFNFHARQNGFDFLNSDESIKLQEEMRNFESRILDGHELDKSALETIDKYENNMINNIHSYCKNNNFKSAIFMCGVAHRKSIIAKVEKLNFSEEKKLNWIIYEGNNTISY